MTNNEVMDTFKKQQRVILNPDDLKNQTVQTIPNPYAGYKNFPPPDEVIKTWEQAIPVNTENVDEMTINPIKVGETV